MNQCTSTLISEVLFKQSKCSGFTTLYHSSCQRTIKQMSENNKTNPFLLFCSSTRLGSEIVFYDSQSIPHISSKDLKRISEMAAVQSSQSYPPGSGDFVFGSSIQRFKLCVCLIFQSGQNGGKLCTQLSFIDYRCLWNLNNRPLA